MNIEWFLCWSSLRRSQNDAEFLPSSSILEKLPRWVLLKKVEPLMGGTVGERDQRGLGCGEKIVRERESERERV